MKVVLLLVLVLTEVFTANCRDQVDNIEASLSPDEPGEDYIFPDGQVDDAFKGEAQHVSMGSENHNIDEEVHEMNKNFDMGSVSDHRASMTKKGKTCRPTASCTRAGGHCVKKRGDCNGRLDRNGCKGNKKCQCCIPDKSTTIPSTTTTASTTTTSDTTTAIPSTTTTASTTTTSGNTCRPTATCTQAGGYCVKKRGDCNGRLDRNGCKGNKKCQCCIPDTATTIPSTTTTAPTTTTSECSAPWITLGGRCYLFGPRPTSWAYARRYCRMYSRYRGGDLAILNTEAKRIAVTDYIVSSTSNGTRYWLGGSNLSGSWLFVDNSTVTSDVWNARQNEPDNGSDACMYTSNEYVSAGEYDLILDMGCSAYFYYICEK